MSPKEFVLYIEDLTVSFDGFKAIDSLNLYVDKNELRVIIGPNGAGKTTLLDLICGKTKSSTGSIQFKEQELTKKSEHAIVRAGVGRKFQTPSIYENLSVFQNLEVSYPRGRSVLGAAEGQTLVQDTTSVNFYQMCLAAIKARPGRKTIIIDASNFPTDRYILAGIAKDFGLNLVTLNNDGSGGPGSVEVEADCELISPEALAPHLNDDVALVTLQAIHYRSGSRPDIKGITDLVRSHGGLVVWDASHAAGAIDLRFDEPEPMPLPELPDFLTTHIDPFTGEDNSADIDGGTLGTVTATLPPRQSPMPEASDDLFTSEISRNAPCPCGSGRKYKHCHGAL